MSLYKDLKDRLECAEKLRQNASQLKVIARTAAVGGEVPLCCGLVRSCFTPPVIVTAISRLDGWKFSVVLFPFEFNTYTKFLEIPPEERSIFER